MLSVQISSLFTLRTAFRKGKPSSSSSTSSLALLLRLYKRLIHRVILLPRKLPCQYDELTRKLPCQYDELPRIIRVNKTSWHGLSSVSIRWVSVSIRWVDKSMYKLLESNKKRLSLTTCGEEQPNIYKDWQSFLGLCQKEKNTDFK